MGDKKKILNGYHKIKLYEYISRLDLPFHAKIIYDQAYFKLNYNLDILKGSRLEKYINFLYTKYHNYEKLNYLDKVKLIKNEQIRSVFLKGKSNLDNKINNALSVDLVILKEIQLEKEGNKNTNKSKTKSQKTTKSVDPTKTSKNKFFNKTINNFNIKNTFYKFNKEEDLYEKSLNVNKVTKIIEKLSNNVIIWIDENYNNKENDFYYKLLSSNKKLIIYRFNNVNSAFKFICFKEEFKFKEIFIIVSGSLFPIYYKEFKSIIKDIIFLPICCIFTSFNKEREIRLHKIKIKGVNDPFYNKEGVKKNFIDCIQAFEKYTLFYNSKLSKDFDDNILGSYEGCFTFEQIFSRNQLVFPFLFNEIMEGENNIISHIDIISINNYIQNNFIHKKIQKYLIPMIYIEKLPIEILSKFFVRIYTEEILFYYSLNQSLMRKENTYDIFVKVLYKGLSLGSLHNSDEDILYRGSKMTKNEIDNIRKSFEEWNK